MRQRTQKVARGHSMSLRPNSMPGRDPLARLVAQHEADAEKIASLDRTVAEVDDLKQQPSAVLQELKARDNLVAQR
jgi:hypothetical protein